MVDQANANFLFTHASEIAKKTPEIGRTLAGNCTTVHFGMLAEARSIFVGSNVQLIVGNIDIDGRRYFDFTDEDIAAWQRGTRQVKYGLHAWLAIDDDILDLTLATTLYARNPELLRPGLTYLDRATALENRITYIDRLSGDDVLLALNIVR